MHCHLVSRHKNIGQLSNGSHFLLLKNNGVTASPAANKVGGSMGVVVMCRTSQERRCAGIPRNRCLALALGEY